MFWKRVGEAELRNVKVPAREIDTPGPKTFLYPAPGGHGPHKLFDSLNLTVHWRGNCQSVTVQYSSPPLAFQLYLLKLLYCIYRGFFC